MFSILKRKKPAKKAKKVKVRKKKVSRPKPKVIRVKPKVKLKAKPRVKVKTKIKVKEVKLSKPEKVKPEKAPKLEVSKMDDEKAYDLLKRYGVPLAPYAFCKNEKELLPTIKKIGFPLAMKVSGDIVHKTEVNGVKLNIENGQDAKRNFNELMKIKGCKKVLVQKMIKEGYELIVGAKQDPQFNGIVVLGAGGIFTEFLKDVSFRVAPLSRFDAEQMLDEVKFSELILKGFRGQKPADKNSIIEVLLSVSRIIEKNDDIKELDINPLFATSKNSLAADVRIILK